LTFETSLKIELLFADDEQVLQVIEQLKTTFNQESIALITNDINSKLI
jgi:3-methyladenine DNA glycosylase AlkC